MNDQKIEKQFFAFLGLVFLLLQASVAYSAYLYAYDKPKFYQSGYLALPCMVGLFADSLIATCIVILIFLPKK